MTGAEQQYIASLARKRMAAGVLIRDGSSRILLLEPSYKPGWEIPGGAVEAGEPPWRAAEREVAEEIGLARPVGRLLVVDHVQADGPLPEGVMFLFDGGRLDAAAVPELALAADEILSAALFTLDEARAVVKPLLGGRLAAALAVVAEGGVALCEHGVRVA